MKKLLLTLLMASPVLLTAQDCSELFISSYVEGYGNNRAIEIYNPTNQTVTMSDYSVGRFSNGSTEFIGVQLQGASLAPYDVYVVVLDKRDPQGSGFEEPIWNGYVLIGEVLDQVTGLPLLDENGNTIIGPQYDADGGTLYGNVYNAEYDLEGKADEFVCPVYNVNNALYHNGNDAVALVKGTTVLSSGENILDVVGVIGQDPGESWVDADGGWTTKDKTLKRKENIKKGTGAVFNTTFDYEQWTIYPKNTFNVIGSHNSECGELIANTNIVASNMFVSPNPATVSATISAQAPITNIIITNIAGQVVQSMPTQLTSSFTFSVEDMESGIYFVSATLNNGQTITQKLMVQ